MSAAPGRAPPALRGLLGEIGDLKRIRSARRHGSVAQRGFRQAWAALAAGADPTRVMEATSAAALAAARLGDLDGSTLLQLGLDRNDSLRTLRAAIDAVADVVEPALVARLRPALTLDAPLDAPPLPFVVDLERQPRAGVTCPGKPRLVLEPPEDHAEHCWAVAVFAVLLSPTYGADPTAVFLAGLSHHFHNALMPDSGFTGEVLLGDRLDDVYAFATEQALAQLAPALRGTIIAARAALPDTETPEGRAFHAADVIDRVMQIAQHLRAASVSMDRVLGEFELVHAGPVKPFHDRVLAEVGLT